MDYAIEADWKLLDGCNYRCGYCFWTPESLGRKIAGLPSADRWADAFDATGKAWLLHITGGEPSLFPDFAHLCRRLARHHYISINSNFSHRSMAEVARTVAPERISLLHAALHPEERDRKAHWPIFQTNMEAALTAGQRVILSVVATPDVIARFGEIARETEHLGLRPVPKMLRGGWHGQGYPGAYTEAEREAFRTAHAWARDGYTALIADSQERPTIWPLDDDETIDSTLNFRGNVCDAGRRFVAIHPDGRVFRCGTDGFLGNLLGNSLSLNADPIRCATSYCPYFCRKYSYKPLFEFKNRSRFLPTTAGTIEKHARTPVPL